MNHFLSILLFAFAIISCDTKPKVVEPVGTGQSTGMTATPQTEISHKAFVEEVIQTSKYTYLQILEGEQKKWIAISKADVSKGAEIVYTGGLTMRAFHSAELDRTFDELLLVSNIKLAGGQSQNLFEQIQKGSGEVSKEKFKLYRARLN
ncbi:MAG: hypothetical protein IPM34_00110 [Saprospiraceae bacterium]|nr:hypothetical protein [Saprospiraceae bacterium]